MSFKPLNMLHKPLVSRRQQGQVMVEYAIILILSITLLIGGIEMAATAFASSKASDGAKAGANEFAEVNEERLTAQQNQSDYLRSLDYLLLHPTNTTDLVPFTAIDVGTTASTTTLNEIYIFTVGGVKISFVKLTSTHDYESFVDFLDSHEDKNLDGALDADENADGVVDAEDYEAMFDRLVDGATINSTDAKLDLGVLDADADGTVSEAELKTAKKDVQDVSFTTIIDETILKIAKVNRYKALIILEQITLSRLPLNPDIGLSKSTPLIGDHDGTLMTNPSCGAATYNTGLPDNDADGVPDTEWPDGSGEYYPAVYLFNPKPINVASCAGVDALRGGRSRLSILAGGYGKPDDANYVKGLPKLNQAMYGQYVNVCLDGANQYVSCSSGSVAQTLLKPPGKLCLSNAPSPTVDSCSIDAPDTGTTGYYFWGQTNDSAGDTYAYTNDEPIEFRPTFQLVCNGNSAKSPLLMDTDCLDSESLATVQINTRYRSVFESFLTFGLLELQDANLAQYFYDPSNLRSLGTNLGVGIAGSELGPKRQNGNPTVKPFKDFRGCYEVNVETNQVSACN